MFITYYVDTEKNELIRQLRISIASARKVFDNANVIILHPEWFPLPELYERSFGIPGLNKLHHYDYRRCLANSKIHGASLFVDCDVIFNKPFVIDWSIADVFVTRRERIDEAAIPYNMGVCFSKTGEFWNDVAAAIDKNNPNEWRESELAFSKIAQCKGENPPPYTIAELPGHLWNATPSPVNKCQDANIIHYKGNRKILMYKREREFIKP